MPERLQSKVEFSDALGDAAGLKQAACKLKLRQQERSRSCSCSVGTAIREIGRDLASCVQQVCGQRRCRRRQPRSANRRILLIWGHSYIDRKAFLCQCSRTGWFKVPCSHRVIHIAQSKLSKLYTFSARVHFAATEVSGSFHDSHQRSLRFAQPRQTSCKTVSPTDMDALGVGSVQVHSVGGQ